MTKFTEVLSRHVWCVIMSAGFIITAILIFGILTEAGASEIFGTISSVVSIVLGVVVIFYTFYQNYIATQSIERIRDIVSEAPKLIAERTASLHETAGRMSEVAYSLSKMMPKLIGQEESKPSSVPTMGDLFTMQLDFTKGSYVVQGFLYSIVKGYEKGKPLNMFELGKILFAPFGKAEDEGLMGVTSLGMLVIISNCFKEIRFDTNPVELTATVSELPDGFVDYVKRQSLKILEGEEGESKKVLKAVDAMFT
jgi:hypothetical protein